MTYVFPLYLAISVSTVTAMNTHTNQATSFFSVYFSVVWRWWILMSVAPRDPQQCQVTAGNEERWTLSPLLYLLESLLYQKLSLRDCQQCSSVFRLWLGSECSHMLKGVSPKLWQKFPLLSWDVAKSLYAFVMGSNNSCLSTTGSLRWR